MADQTEPNGKTLWPLWMKNQAWREEIAEEATRKALDIPKKNVNINQRSGLGWPELLVFALALLGAGALGVFGLSALSRPTIVPPVAPTVINSPAGEPPVVNISTPNPDPTQLPDYRVTIE